MSSYSFFANVACRTHPTSRFYLCLLSGRTLRDCELPVALLRSSTGTALTFTSLQIFDKSKNNERRTSNSASYECRRRQTRRIIRREHVPPHLVPSSQGLSGAASCPTRLFPSFPPGTRIFMRRRHGLASQESVNVVAVLTECVGHFWIPHRQHRSPILFAIPGQVGTGRVEIVCKLGLEGRA
jgi:hypothetical protein